MTHVPPPRRADIEARVGELLAGRFRLQRVLGAGGMGWVYLAIQEPLGRRVAVKVLATQLRTGDFQQRFFREASVAARLSSPHIVTVHDYGATDDGELFIAMEYVEGVPVNMALRREPSFAPARICALVRQLCRGLAVAHDAGVVHRDLKPSNIMLLRDRHGEELVKILDFGLVKTLGDDQDGELTGAEAVLGSPNYMSPEQIRRLPVDQRTDVYATGALIYRLLTGHNPFEAGTPVETMTMHLREAPPPVERYLPQPDFTQRQLAAVALRCMEKRPEQRYASMDEVAEALEAVERLMPKGALAPPRRSSSSVDLTPHPTAPLAGPISLSGPGGPALDDVTTPAQASLPERTPPSVTLAPAAPPPRRLGASAVVLGLGLAAAALVGAVALLSKGDGAAPSVAEAPQPVLPSPPPAPLPEAPAPAPAPAVKVRLTSAPPGAQARVGPRVLGTTPVELDLPTQEAPLEVVFELDGYVTETRQVSLHGEAVELSVELRARPRRPHRVAPPPPSGPASPVKKKLKANPYD